MKGGKREGSGRPPLPPGQKRKPRSLKATDAEWTAIRQFAKELKQSANRSD